MLAIVAGIADGPPTQPLASWTDGAARRALMDFIASATSPGPGFVEVADRIAAFDNDGTLRHETTQRLVPASNTLGG